MSFRRGRGTRRRRPGFELLEARRPLAIDFAAAYAIAPSGTSSDVRANAVAEDDAGFVYVAGSIRGTADFSPGGGTRTTAGGSRDAFVAKYSATGGLVWVSLFRGQSTASVGQASAIAVDGSGGVLVAGTLSGSTSFVTGSGTKTLASPARNDVFVARLDAAGKTTWATASAGDPSAIDEAYAVAPDGSGGAFLAGSYTGSASFGGTSLVAGGSSEAFAARVDPTGAFVWAASTRGSGSSTAEARGIAVDPNGRVVLAGFLSGSVDFDPGPGVTTMTSAGSRDSAIWVLSGSGTFAWARSTAGTDFDQAFGVAVDRSGNIYATGGFSGTVDFDPGPGVAPITAASGGTDVFVLKLTPAGDLGWAETFAGNGGSSRGQGIVVDALGRVVVAGWFSGTVDFDPGAGVASLSATGGIDVFVATLGPLGDAMGSTRGGGANSDMAFAVATNASNKVAIAGTYTGSAIFGSSTVSTSSTTSFFFATLTQTTTPPPTPVAPTLQAASDTGASASDRVTASTSPGFDAVATSSGLTLQLLRDGTVVASRTGSGPLIDPGRVPDGVHAYATRQVDSFGTVGAASPSVSVTIDTAAPAAPTNAPRLATADDTGVVGDGLTSVRTPRLVVNVEPNATAQVVDDSGAIVAGGAADASGLATLVPPRAWADGVYLLRVRAIDLAGNVGGPSPSLTLTIDATPPPAPTGLALLAADDSGVVGDGITNVRQPRIVGSAEPGATVLLVNVGGNGFGTAIANGLGVFTLTPSNPLPEGTTSLYAVATDAAGNTGVASVAITITLDTTAPAIPVAPRLLAADDSGVVGDGITNVRQPRIVGTAEAGAAVRLIDPSGTVVGAGAATGGSYSIQLASLGDGSYSLRAVAIDVAGNASAPGPAFAMVIDGTAPAAPTIPSLLAADDSGVVGDGLTNVRQPRFTVTAEVGSTVRLLNAQGVVVGTATVGAGGMVTLAPTAPLSDGTYSFSASAVDPAGNLGPASGSTSIAIDGTAPVAPSAPSLLAADDSGTFGDGITNVRQPRIVGSAEPGAFVQIVATSGSILGTATVGGNGAFSITPASPLVDGTYVIQARATDAAGNVGPLGPSFRLVILATPPSRPAAPMLLPADDSGTAGDGLTNVATPRLTGSASIGLTVRLLDAKGAIVGTTVVPASGTYVVAPNDRLVDGVTLLAISLVDAAGNVGPTSPTVSLTIDTIPPAMPTGLVLLASDDSGVVGDGITNVRQPRIVGSAEPGSTVRIADGSGRVIARGAASASGSFSLQATTALADGTYAIRAGATDAAGNVGGDGASFTLTILATPPGPPSLGLLAVDDSGLAGDGVTRVRGPRLSGTASPSSLVELIDGAGNLLGSTSSGSDGSYTLSSAATTVGSFVFRTRATDIAGNVGALSPLFTVRILATVGDFDGDGKADPVSFNPGTDVWTIRSSIDGSTRSVAFGAANVDVPIPADYDGDGKTDLAVFHPQTAEWFILSSMSGSLIRYAFGWPGVDLPVAEDYDGDGKADIAVFRPNTGEWFVRSSITGTTSVRAFGAANADVPIPADYDGDGKSDLAVFHPANAGWYVLRSTDGVTTSRLFGWVGVDRPIPADFDGDGKADIAVFRPNNATWFVNSSASGTTQSYPYGWVGVDRPVPLDYDGDGKADLAVYRPFSGEFYIQGSRDGARSVVALGIAGSERPALVPMTYRLNGLQLVSGGQTSAQRVGQSRTSSLPIAKGTPIPTATPKPTP